VDWRLFGSAVHRVSTTRNLSRYGAMLESVSEVPVGAPLVLAVETREGPIQLHARVAWTAVTGMGVRFTQPAHERLLPA